MITFEAELGLVHVIEEVEDLNLIPEPEGDRLFLDIESSGLRPYNGDRICGIAFCYEKGDAYYIPYRHFNTDFNIPVDTAIEFFEGLLNKFTKWVNHNIKFDAHFLWQDGLEFKGQMICTLMMSMLIDAEAQSHSLKNLCREVLNLSMEDKDIVELWFKERKIKKADKVYAEVPPDILGKYAGMDVLSNRALYYALVKKVPKSMLNLMVQEINLTKRLFHIERRGIHIDRRKNILDGYAATTRLVDIVAELEATFAIEFKDSTGYKQNIICDQLGLPIVHRSLFKTDKRTGLKKGGTVSFDKDALVKYRALPQVVSDPFKTKVIELLQEYSTIASHQKLFMVPFEEYITPDEKIYPSYSQNVRTGRMSSRGPSISIQTKNSKELIIPGPGLAFADYDADQVEFRVIVDYCRNPMALKAYAENPKTDFHQWIADTANIMRKLAKKINFSLAYGAGEKKILSEISIEVEVVTQILEEMNGVVDEQEFQKRIMARARDIFNKYHQALPEVKQMADSYSNLCKQQGYVENRLGRRRRIPWKYTYSAFNTLVQGETMDIIKGRIIDLEQLEKDEVFVVLNVHDSILFEGPKDVLTDITMHNRIKSILEVTPPGFEIPLPWSGGFSTRTWKEAGTKEIIRVDDEIVAAPFDLYFAEQK